MYTVALFDADGVLVTPGEPFSHTYFRSIGHDPLYGESFFRGPFQAALRGEVDLKELIVTHNDLWQWQDDPQLLLDKWFQTENHPNKQLLDYIQQLRRQGIQCYLVTDQERYRLKYLQTVMFKDTLDGIFASCQFGHVKKEPQYFKKLLQALGKDPADVIYFDDGPANIEAAKQAGIDARLYSSFSDVTATLVI